MSEFSGPQTGVNTFDASRWRDFYSNLFGIGVFKGGRVQGSAGGDLAVTNSSALNAQVAIGAACIKGFLYATDAAVTKTLAAADPSNPRIDTIVLSWSYASGVPTCVVAVKTGTPAGAPVAPSLTQNDTTYEFPLADCRVNAGATTISLITDRRAYCSASNTAALTGATFTGAIAGTAATFSGQVQGLSLVSGSNITASGSSAGLELGAKASSNTPYVDFNSSGNNNDYDVRLSATGGDGSNGDGTLNIVAGALHRNGATVWDSSNDGSSSGLDADLLDGNHASAFLGVSATAADSSKLGGVAASSFPQRGSHNAVTFTLSADVSLPASLNQYEIFFLLA